MINFLNLLSMAWVFLAGFADKYADRTRSIIDLFPLSKRFPPPLMLGRAAVYFPGDIVVHSPRVIPVDQRAYGIVSCDWIDIGPEGQPAHLHA